MVGKIKNKRHKKMYYKKNYKNCLEVTQLENKINYLEKINININSLNKIMNNS